MITVESIDRILSRYGCEVSFAPNGKTFSDSYRAFVQPLRYKNKMYLEGLRSRLGYIDQSYYLYIGPASVDISELSHEARLKMGEQRFFFSHSEKVQLADDVLYMWAILRKAV